MNSTARIFLLMFTFTVALPCSAKEQDKTFAQSCDEVWEAVKAVAGTGQYRILSVDKEDRIISFAVGGWAGVRELSAHLQGEKKSCTVTVQSRFTGIVHHDAPDFLKRIEEKLSKKADGDAGKSPWNYSDPTRNEKKPPSM